MNSNARWLLVMSFLLLMARSVQAQSDNREIKNKALLVLSAKCNVCHIKKNPIRIFNSITMDTYAEDIYDQVFVRKRMPKGKKIKLSEAEYKLLSEWLQTRENPTVKD